MLPLVILIINKYYLHNLSINNAIHVYERRKYMSSTSRVPLQAPLINSGIVIYSPVQIQVSNDSLPVRGGNHRMTIIAPPQLSCFRMATIFQMEHSFDSERARLGIPYHAVENADAIDSLLSHALHNIVPDSYRTAYDQPWLVAGFLLFGADNAPNIENRNMFGIGIEDKPLDLKIKNVNPTDIRNYFPDIDHPISALVVGASHTFDALPGRHSFHLWAEDQVAVYTWGKRINYIAQHPRHTQSASDAETKRLLGDMMLRYGGKMLIAEGTSSKTEALNVRMPQKERATLMAICEETGLNITTTVRLALHALFDLLGTDV